jgi:hypothetical protein
VTRRAPTGALLTFYGPAAVTVSVEPVTLCR